MLMHWLRELKGRVRFKEPLSIHTTLHIGGPADVWVEPDNFAELRKIICRCVKEKIPYLVIGKGSNILFSDSGFRGVIICLNAPAFTKIEFKGNYVSCGAGSPLNQLIKQTKVRGLGGLEFLAGIPATVAGALVMNAGNCRDSIGSLVQSVTVMDCKGKKKALKGKQLRFAYRQSNFNSYILLEAVLRLVKRNPAEIGKDIVANLSRKRKRQDLAAKSAGCIFKNPLQGLTAAEMIESCGLKHLRRGQAEISAKHANFFVNRNDAKAQDILYLINLVQGKVKKRFGVSLEPEIRIVK